MTSRFSLIRNYALRIAAVLTLCFAVVVGIIFFYFVQVERLKVRTADFHLATIQSTFRIKEVLFDLRSRISGLQYRLQSITPVADGGPRELPRDALRHSSLIQVIVPAMTSITDLQGEFGGQHFGATIARSKFYCDQLTERLADSSPLAEGTLSDLLTTVSALELSLSQLERLHAISYDDATKLYERNTRLANLILVPFAVVIILVGLFALRYFVGQIGTALDRQAQAEDGLSRLNAELESRIERRTAELRSTEEELVRKERLATIGQVTATVSHELRNPLGAVRAGFDAIKSLAVSGGARFDRAMLLVDRSLVRCDRIIADLLDFTRVRHLNWETTSVDDWLGEVLDECDVAKGVSLNRELASGVECQLDRDRLRRAVQNVILNACQAMENGVAGNGATADHRLTVASQRSDGRLMISVDDTGHGIAPDDTAKVFEPLYSTKAIGVGLGLPMVKQIVEQHGGEVELNSTPGLGTEIVLWLPLHLDEDGAPS